MKTKIKMKVSEDALKPAYDMIKEFESCRLKAYVDGGGVWTIGWGETFGVYEGMVITQEQADLDLVSDVLEIRLPTIRDCVKVPLTINELCALISFEYNVGIKAFAKSTLVKKLNAGAPLVDVADEFLKWDKDNGKVVRGLTRRRKAERALFLKREVVQFVA